MASPVVTIDGKPVALFGAMPFAVGHGASEPKAEFLWVVSFGVDSPVVEWELASDVATYVLGKKEVTLAVKGGGAPPLTVKRAFVIGATQSTNKRRMRIQFGDIRRTLKYTNPVAAINVRAGTGNNSKNGFDGSGKFIQAIPQFAYRLYSVNSDGSAVEPAAVIKKVMDLSCQSTSDWVLDSPPRSTLIPNDIQLYDRGDVAVWRMLGTIGGIDMYVDPADGLMHIRRRVQGDEKDAIEARIPADGKRDYEGFGKMVWRDESHNRPAGFDFQYAPWMEFRTDFIESGGTQSQDKDDFWSENVAEVMEYRPGNYLSVTPAGTRQCLPGEFLEIGRYLATMPNGPLVPALSKSLLQAGYNNTNLIYGILGDGQIPDPGEESRIKSAVACYRTVMRLNPRIASRCRPGSIIGFMASVADAETGRRKPSDVYLDHCVIPTLEVALGNTTSPFQGWNRDSFPPIDSTANGSEKSYADNPALSDMRVAPFDAIVKDGDSGLWLIKAREDFQDERESVVPCRVVNLPTLDYTQANNSLALYFWDQAPVAASHRVSAILSAIPGVGVYHVPVSMSDAGTRLGVSAKAGIAPMMSIYIGHDLLAALFAWDDSKREQVKQVFLGTLAGKDDDPLKTLVPSNLDVLKDYAKGSAAAILANYLDHYEGNQVVPFEPSILPVGSLHTITHRVSGSYTTTLNCMPVKDPFLADHFLSAGTLANVRGRVTT